MSGIDQDYSNHHPLRPRTLIELVTLLFMDAVVEAIKIAVSRKEGSNVAYRKLMELSALIVYEKYQDALRQQGINDAETLLLEYLLPRMPELLAESDQVVAQDPEGEPGRGPAGFLRKMEDAIHGQVGHVPIEDLQQQWEAFTKETDLVLASESLKQYAHNVAVRIRRSGYSSIEYERLKDELYNRALKTARHNTGPTQLKKAGKAAGQAKTLDYAFSFIKLREDARELAKEANQDVFVDKMSTEEDQAEIEHGFSVADIDRFCTPTQARRLKAHYLEGLSMGEIAKKEGVNKKSVFESINAAKARIRKGLQQ